MTDREIMERLLAGGAVRNGGVTYFLDVDRLMRDGSSALGYDMFAGRCEPCERPEPPNPHKAGTHAWAREELRRGHAVKRPGHAPHEPTASLYSRWSDADLDATDWVRA